MRWIAVLPLLLLPGVTGCSQSCEDFYSMESPEDEDLPTLQTVDEDEANLTLFVVGYNDRETPVTVTFDGEVLLTASLPEVPNSSSCGDSSPVFRYDFAVDDGPHQLAAEDGEQDASLDIEARDRHLWVLLGSQDPFPLDLTLYRHRPQFG